MQELTDVGNTFPLKLGLRLQGVRASDKIPVPPPVPADPWAQDSWMSASCAMVGKGWNVRTPVPGPETPV